MSREVPDSWTCSFIHRAWREEQQVLIFPFCCVDVHVSLWIHSCLSQAGLLPPQVLTLTSGQAALHRIVPVPGSSIRADGQAEAGCAVTDLEEAVRSKEGVSFTSSQVVDRLQVIVNCDVTQLLPAPQSPPSSQDDDAHHQSHQQGGQNTGSGERGGGRLRGLTQGWLEARLECELTTGTHEPFRALAHRAGEVGETSAAVLAGTSATGIWTYAAVFTGVAKGAGAGVVVHTVLAGPRVLAGARGTVVNVDLAVGAGEAGLTTTQDTLAQVQTLATCRGEKHTLYLASCRPPCVFKVEVLMGFCLKQSEGCIITVLQPKEQRGKVI